jgi:hypothetical protein
MEKSTGAIIIQGDKSILLEVHHEAFPQARADIAPFTEIEKSPEHFILTVSAHSPYGMLPVRDTVQR